MSQFPNQHVPPQPQNFYSQPRVSGLAITSMILGILGLVSFFAGGGLIGVVAVVIGVVAIAAIKKNPLQLGGVGLAWAGTITGIVSIAATAFVFVFGLYWAGKAGGAGRRVATEAQLNGLDSAIRKYAMDFNGAIPGAYPQVATKSGCQTVTSKPANALTAADFKISGTQNLVISLSYALNGTNTGVEIPGGAANAFQDAVGNRYATPCVEIPLANGPMDFSITTVASTCKQYPPYYSPTRDDLKTVNVGFRLTSVSYAWNAGSGNAFPVIVDRFSDPLPILYFRRDQPNGAWTADNKSTPASYYRQENCEYFDGNVASPSGAIFNQGRQSSYSAASGSAAGNLAIAIMSQVGASSSSYYGSRGDFVLLSAGPDRIYGSDGGRPSDDLMHVTMK